MNSTNQSNKFSDSLTSAKRVLAALLAGLLIMMFLPGELVARVNAYLPLHIALETGAIITATMVFVMGWHTISIRPNYRVLVMACCFFGVALLDFSHMISFDGMPDFISPSAPEKAINFWLAARLFAAVAMLAYILLPASEAGTGARWMVLAGVLLAVALFHVWFLYFPQWVPTTFDPVTGLTWFKVGSELSFSVVFAVCAVVLWQRCQAEGRQDVLDLSLACGTMAVSEIFFTIYVSVDDGYALIGHIYKIAAHGLLYRAIVVKGVKQPYREIEMLGQRIAATLDALPDMLFELSADGVIYDYHSKRHHHQLLASPEEFLGKSIELFMPPHALRTIKEAIADIDATGVTNARQYYIGEGEQKSWFELSGAALTTMSGETRYVMVVRDITERMQADIEQRIAATAFSAQEGIMITDAETRILRVNDSFEKATGYTEQEVIGKNLRT
jgi:PAS domain S-box-containing protein